MIVLILSTIVISLLFLLKVVNTFQENRVNMQREILKANLTPNRIQKKEEKKKQAVSPGRKIGRPMIVGYMSVDVLREYHSDLSQLKYLSSIPEGRLHFDLNYNIEKAVKRTTDDNDEKISLLLKFILDQKERLKSLISNEIIFISYRRTLIDAMCNVYNCTPVSIVASLFNNCIYLCTIESPQEILRRQSCKEIDKFCAWGYKFEQFMLSDAPNEKPDIEKPVLENEEFTLFYYTQLGNHRLFYGAQIDGMHAMKNPFKKVPNTDNVETNLKYLKKHRYVELKTNKEIYHRVQLVNFKKYKLLRCWCQCYLAGLKGLLVGYRDEDGIIKRVEWFDTNAIAKYCKGRWSPQTTIAFLNCFLNFVKQSFTAKFGKNCDSSTPLTLKFEINEQHKFSVSKTDDEAHVILPRWYVENIAS